MTDTLGISTERTNIPEADFNNLIATADKSTFNAITQTLHYVKKVNNLNLFINDYGVSIQGSLSGLYFGNNFSSLNRETLPLAIDLLEDSLNIPLRNAKVTRLDLAQTILLDHHPSAYFNYFGNSNFQQRLEHPNGLEHRNGERKMLFYDKVEEMRKTKKTVPTELKNLNLGRFEVSFQGKKSVNRHMETEDLTLGDLCKPEVYSKMYQVWGKAFDSIEKLNDGTTFLPQVFRNPKQLCNQLTYEGIKVVGGAVALRKMVETAKQSGVFKTQKQYSSARRKLRQLNTIPDLAISNPLMEELEQKVHDIVQHSI